MRAEPAVRDDIPGAVWRPIHYLGSKLRATDFISRTVSGLRVSGTAACDLFAGSGTVAARLGELGPVVANDIQEYSRVICSALLISTDELDPAKIVDAIASSPARKALLRACAPLVDYEREAIAAASAGDLVPLATLQESAPMQLIDFSMLDGPAATLMRGTLRALEQLPPEHYHASVPLRHFGGSYFTVSQAIDLSSILAFARSLPASRDQVLAAGLSVSSDVVNSVGKQFAQPLMIRDRVGDPKPHIQAKVVREKTLSALELLGPWLDRYSSRASRPMSHRVVREDFATALATSCADVSVVYADPPYGREHYSRYYHVLETMSLGDDPAISSETSKRTANWSTGAYRTDRHQSPFCIKSKAPAAFESLFQGVRRLGASLVLSYSPTNAGQKPRARVMALDDLYSMAKRSYRNVDLVTVPNIEHMKMNRKELNSDKPSGSEVVLVCS